MAEHNQTPWRDTASRAAVKASTGTTYWTVVATPHTRRASDLLAPPIVVGTAPVPR